MIIFNTKLQAEPLSKSTSWLTIFFILIFLKIIEVRSHAFMD